MPFSRGPSQARDRTHLSRLPRRWEGSLLLPRLHGDRTPTLCLACDNRRAHPLHPSGHFSSPSSGFNRWMLVVLGVVNRQQKYVKLLKKYVKTVIVFRVNLHGF